jgi:hypothetical protein
MRLEKGSEIYYVEYLDHGFSRDPLEKIVKKPLLLFCVGCIINLHGNEEYYAVVSSGTRFHERKPSHYTYIVKKAITKMEVIYRVEE